MEANEKPDNKTGENPPISSYVNDKQLQAIGEALKQTLSKVLGKDLKMIGAHTFGSGSEAEKDLLAALANDPKTMPSFLTPEQKDALGKARIAALKVTLTGDNQARVIPEDLRPPKIWGWIKKICAQTGDPLPELVMQPGVAPDMISSTTGHIAGTTKKNGEKAIIIAPYSEEYIPESQMPGYLAHEIGHLHYNHSRAKQRAYKKYDRKNLGIPYVLEFLTAKEFRFWQAANHRQEFMADAFAAKYGYAQSLIDQLEYPDGTGSGKYNGVSFTHPATADRIEHLRKLALPVAVSDEQKAA